MNKTLSTTLIVIAVLALAGGIFFAGSMYARANTFGNGMLFNNGRNNNGVYGPGMMGGNGMMNNRGWNNGTNSNVTPLTVDQARAAAEKYIQSINIQGLETGEVMIQGLETGEVMIFDNNAYVIVTETETGLGAFELLVDPASQIAYPEFGPNMMWNLKYGGLGHGSMMGQGRMMGGWDNQTTPANLSTEMSVSPEQAIGFAQQYLDGNYAGATAATDPMQFYGYYTLDFEKDGKIVGMLSVNGYNGQVFLHTWHGTFIEEAG